MQTAKNMLYGQMRCGETTLGKLKLNYDRLCLCHIHVEDGQEQHH